MTKLPDGNLVKRKGDAFVMDFEGRHYSMPIAVAEEMLAYLEEILDAETVNDGLPEFIQAIRDTLGKRQH